MMSYEMVDYGELWRSKHSQTHRATVPLNSVQLQTYGFEKSK